MIIETPKYKRNIIFIRKNGFGLYEFKKEQPKNNNNNIINILPNISIKNKDKKETSKTMDINKSSKVKKIIEKKKDLFLNNVLSTEKDYFLKDYIKQKEIKILKDKNKNKYQARKTFFSEKKIDNCRTSYFNKEVSNYKYNNDKQRSLLIKDIEADLLLMKKKRNERYKEYLKKQLKLDLYENRYFVDFNEKLGVKNVYMKTNIFYKRKEFLKNNPNVLDLKYLKTLTNTYNNMKRKIIK